MLSHLIAFAALAAVLVAIPGPAVILVVKNAALYGRRTAMLTGVGVFSGDLVWITASVTGLTALLVASRPAFEAPWAARVGW
jgi:threonine/homoserine/homoserine lactone efflux protein